MSRQTIETAQTFWEFTRQRTLSLLDQIAERPDTAAALAWRAGDGRAHIGWQLTHVGVTEELFATERIPQTTPAFGDLIPRFRGGSTPDDDVPSIEQIREVLTASRAHLLETFARIDDTDLDDIPEPMRERGLSLGGILRLLPWHEAHHHGQAHATLNLFKAQVG